jgi:TetR/AcrR family transcriptional repressor of nem operon
MGQNTNGTRQRLIDTAQALIWKSSYGAVSVDDICKAADVKKGSFYHYFPSKVDLAVATMEESHAQLKVIYDECFSPGIGPLARFEKLADAVYQAQVETAAKYGMVCGCPCASMSSEMACQEDSVRNKFEEISRRQERYYETALRDLVADGLLPGDTDVRAKAEEIYAYFLGQLTMARIQNSLESLKQNLKPGLLRTLGLKQTLAGAA